MKRWYFFLAVALGLATASLSAHGNEVYKFDPAHSTIAFQVRQFLGTVKGRFTKFSGTIEVDRDHPEQSSVIATIQVASIDTTIAKRDEHLRSDDEIKAELRNRSDTIYHPIGTCRMGSDDGAVVDPELRVRGLQGLRIADASIMPTLIGGNTNAACIMIGEKAADMIRSVH